MTAQEYGEWWRIVEMCAGDDQRSINVGSDKRRAAIIAVDAFVSAALFRIRQEAEDEREQKKKEVTA